MTSLYDLLGARAEDDELAIKKAFRKAVKAHHPDLHPGDPDAVLRFRRIITASAILRDAKQRAAYDEILEIERRQIKLRLDNQHLQLQHERRQIWRKRIRATAVVAIAGGLICGYGLFSLRPTTAIIALMKDKPAAGTAPPAGTATIVETIKKNKVAAATAGRRTKTPAAEKLDATETPKTSGAQVGGQMGGLTGSSQLSGPAGDQVDGQVGSRVRSQVGSRVEGHAIARTGAADAGMAEDASRLGAASAMTDAADKGEGSIVVADSREPAHAAVFAVTHDARFYRELGTAAWRIGDFPQAIVNLDEAIRLDPDDAQAHDIRGNAFDETGVFDGALADYEAAIRIDPNNPVFFHDRAVLWRRKGDLDQAIVDLDRAIRFSFSDPNLYCDRGLVWYEKGSQARAIADFNNAMKLDANFAAACISRGLILHRNSASTVASADPGKSIHVSPSVFDVSRKMK
jgi:tetratricopeptide (TPR) repeat protein